MTLLEDRAYVDHRVGRGTRRREALDRRRLRGQKFAQLPGARVALSWSATVSEDIDAPGPVRPRDVAEMDWFGIGQPDDRGGVEAHPHREPLGEMLPGRFGGDRRRRVPRGDARGDADLCDEVSLELLWIEPLGSDIPRLRTAG